MKKIIAYLTTLAIMITLTMAIPPETAGAITVLPTTSSTPAPDCTFLGIEGKYITQIQDSINLINKIRLEACNEGVENPDTGNPLTPDDYVPIQWSADLEYIARIRAAEASVTMNHARTNGESIWFSGPNGIRSNSEVIAWNWSETMTDGINQWYGEKYDWVNNTGGVTGHYTSMIDPCNRFVGLGTFCSDITSYYNTTAGEFSRVLSVPDKSYGNSTGTIIQTLEVKNEDISYEISGSNSFYITAAVTFRDYWSGVVKTTGLTLTADTAENVQWSTSDSNIVSVSNGNVNLKSCGTAVITAKLPDGSVISKTISNQHSYKTTTVQPTCTSEGTKTYTCTICGEKKTESIPKTQHSFGAYVVKRQPTVTTEGIEERTCSVCGAKEQRTIAKLTAPSIRLSKTEVTLTKGETITLKAFVSSDNAADKTVTWTSSNKNVATVSNGKITAKGAGTATITAKTSNGKKATCKVTVKNPKTVNPTSVKLSKTSVTLNKGKTTTLKATVNPSNATNKKVTWKTSNSKVATVSNGKITAKAAGTATITAQTANGKKATCKVTVKNPKTVNPTSVKLSKTSVTLYKGKNTTIKATVNPSNATNKKVTWKTSNSKVATVSNGKITAKAAGTATITVQTANGKKATCRVTVKNPKTVNPTSVKLSKTSVTLGKGKTTTLKATVNPSNATNKKVTWTTSNKKVATVSNGKITAKGVGTATITVKTANGKKATCKVTVKNLPTSVKLSKTSATLKKGKTTTLKATITPSKNVISTVTWSTSNSKVATVKNGKVTAKAKGTATITVKTTNGKKATCKITVK